MIRKALALGADAVLIARPFVTAVYGGGQEGIQAYVSKLQAELADTMAMCGATPWRTLTALCSSASDLWDRSLL